MTDDLVKRLCEWVRELEGCDRCGGEGHLYSGHPNDPHPRDAGECRACKGTGEVEPDQPAIPPDDSLDDIRF